jgi:hypothetical protein
MKATDFFMISWTLGLSGVYAAAVEVMANEQLTANTTIRGAAAGVGLHLIGIVPLMGIPARPSATPLPCKGALSQD